MTPCGPSRFFLREVGDEFGLPPALNKTSKRACKLAHVEQLSVIWAVGMAGAVSRTATAPVDRVKMMLQAHDGLTPLTVRQGFRQMASEGAFSAIKRPKGKSSLSSYTLQSSARGSIAGTTRAFFRGNGTNVLKIAPETAIKLTFNDRVKHLVCADLERITPLQRLFAGAISGAVAQAGTSFLLLEFFRENGLCDCQN